MELNFDATVKENLQLNAMVQLGSRERQSAIIVTMIGNFLCLKKKVQEILHLLDFFYGVLRHKCLAPFFESKQILQFWRTNLLFGPDRTLRNSDDVKDCWMDTSLYEIERFILVNLQSHDTRTISDLRNRALRKTFPGGAGTGNLKETFAL